MVYLSSPGFFHSLRLSITFWCDNQADLYMNGGYVIDNLRIKIVSIYSCFQLWVHVLLFDKQELS